MTPQNLFKVKVVQLKKRKKLEAHEQEAFVEWLTWMKIPHFAIPNGGSRNKAEAANLKKSGVKAGVSDLFIMVPNKYHHGLYIEMKKPKGGYLTQEQKDFIELAIDMGYCAASCNGWDEAKKLTQKYLQYSRKCFQKSASNAF